MRGWTLLLMLGSYCRNHTLPPYLLFRSANPSVVGLLLKQKARVQTVPGPIQLAHIAARKLKKKAARYT